MRRHRGLIKEDIQQQIGFSPLRQSSPGAIQSVAQSMERRIAA
jgi:hypothetical protein